MPRGGKASPTCTKCGVVKTAENTSPNTKGGRVVLRGRCKQCTSDDQCAREKREGQIRRGEFVLEGMLAFGTAIERACGAALLESTSVADAAAIVQLDPSTFRAHIIELNRRAARSGFSPTHDQTKTAPPGQHIKGVSTYYDRHGHVRGQWVKTKADDDAKQLALLDAVASIAEPFRAKADPVAAALTYDEDLLCVYPMGDPHLGMYAWAEETGQSFDIAIAEANLVAAVDHLVELAPPAREALIINLGDFFHADNKSSMTTAGTRVDTDTRWGKVLSIGIRTMRRCIDRALEKHERVRVVCEIGNHDDHSSVMLAICLSQYYEREPRVFIDTSPSKFHWYRFGKNLIGITHGDMARGETLPGVMACDRAKDWGETEHRYWYCGHVHHDSAKEFPGVIVETFRTLAPRDKWHSDKGYRSGQDMKLDVVHREHGRQNRHIVGIKQVFARVAGVAP